jgi:hypothetical protein
MDKIRDIMDITVYVEGGGGNMNIKENFYIYLSKKSSLVIEGKENRWNKRYFQNIHNT